MWLVSDECTWVGWKTKRLWNSCQVRTAQNGLLTAFYISLHHSSWTLPLIFSPALTWEFNFFFSCCFFFCSPLRPPTHLLSCAPSLTPVGAVSVATGIGAAAVASPAAGAMERGHAGRVVEPLQPGWAGQDPGSLSGERSENISCAGRWLQGSRKDHSDLDWKANDG